MFDIYAESIGWTPSEKVKDFYLKGLLEARHRVIAEEENEFNLIKKAYEQGSFDAQRGIENGFKDWYNCIQNCENIMCENYKYCQKSLKL